MPVYTYQTEEGKKYYVKCSINNKQVCRRGFDTKKEAIIFEASLYNSDEKNKIKINLTFDDIHSNFLVFLKQGYKGTTYYRYKGVFKNHIFSFFGKHQLKKIDNNILKLFCDKINKMNYIDKQNLIFCAKMLLSFASQFSKIRYNEEILFIYRPNKEVIKRKFDFYTYDEFKHFLDVIEPKRDRLLFQLLFSYGLRISELTGLCHENSIGDKVFIENARTTRTEQPGQVVQSNKSSSSERIYPILEEIKVAYTEYVESLNIKSPQGVLFPGKLKKKNSIGETTIRDHNKLYSKKAGLKTIKIHWYRHSCASDLINNGFSPEQVAYWLGHKNYTTTLRVYAHLFPSRKLEIANFYNNRFKKGSI